MISLLAYLRISDASHASVPIIPAHFLFRASVTAVSCRMVWPYGTSGFVKALASTGTVSYKSAVSRLAKVFTHLDTDEYEHPVRSVSMLSTHEPRR